jgi:hypothetical protein
VTGRQELDLDARSDRHRTFVADRLEQRDRAKRVRLAVERQRRRMARIPVAVRIGRVLLLNPSRVGQDDAAEIAGAGGAEDAAAKPLHHEPRKISAVVEVRVREHDRVE